MLVIPGSKLHPLYYKDGPCAAKLTFRPQYWYATIVTFTLFGYTFRYASSYTAFPTRYYLTECLNPLPQYVNILEGYQVDEQHDWTPSVEIDIEKLVADGVLVGSTIMQMRASANGGSPTLYQRFTAGGINNNVYDLIEGQIATQFTVGSGCGGPNYGLYDIPFQIHDDGLIW